MIALYLTLFISLVLAVLFLVFFIQSVKGGQYDDAYSPSVRMLFDDDEPAPDEVTDTSEES
ncbi:MAG: cbb3-type cytochrome oxidase assembly protein CcoS [Chlorobi bacterium]|nr:cbb3-type cytochrome oxidase assembly protein CcoS [Chlorobiota bacterium]